MPGPATAAEKLLRATLWEFGIRFRTNIDVMGTVPSITVPNCKVAIFVQDCEEYHCPSHSSKRDRAKVAKEASSVDSMLKKADWTVIRVWQHEVENRPRLVAGRLSLIVRTVRKAMTQSA